MPVVFRLWKSSLDLPYRYFLRQCIFKPMCSDASQLSSSTHSISTSDCIQQDPSTIVFRNPEVAHAAKTNFELLRGLMVFKLCSFPFFVRRNKQLMTVGRKILGKTLFRNIMRATFYGHFVGGENPDDIKLVIRRMRKFGVKSILDYSVEKDIEESTAIKKVKESLAEVVCEPDVRSSSAPKEYQTSLEFADRSKKVVAARTFFYESEQQCDRNMETFIKCIDYVSDSTENEGFAAIKLTALGRPQFLLQMSDFLIQMQRLFSMLIGGTEQDVKEKSSVSFDMENLRKRLEDLGVTISYDENAEWFTLLDVSGDGVVDLLDWSHLKAFEHDLSRIFKVKNRTTGKMEQLVPTLTEDGLEQMRSMLQRIDNIASHARSRGVRVMVDAEQTYFQPAIRRLTMEMMRLFNRNSAVIFNTYQCYLKETKEHLHQDLHHASVEDFCFGAKLVRGAYIEQERARAKALGYPDPICEDYNATTKMYESCVIEVLRSIKQRPPGKTEIMMATHNEETVRFVLKRMHEYNMTAEQRQICFGQLFGMCDQLSFTLGQSGYSVYKYVPYGPVEEVLPYLSRRASENGSLLSNTKLERSLMWSELKRRLKRGDFFHSV